jgi:FAD/FMN-containing dehydrogenase
MTGLASGAHPDADEIALSLERMTGIEEVDKSSATLTALAGTPLCAVQQAADAAGFLYGVDLGARASCTIGGTVATNAGGHQVIRYGMTRRNVLGLEAVLADGTIVRSLNKMTKNNTGYDWVQLLIGSEGTLGIVTRVVLALHAKPAGVLCVLAAAQDLERVIRLLRSSEQRFAGALITFEAMWSEFYRRAVGPCGCRPPMSANHNLYVILEIATGEGGKDRTRLEAWLGAELEAELIESAVIANSEQERNNIWAVRDSVALYRQKLPPATTAMFDVSVPLDRMSTAVANLRAAVSLHWPNGELSIFGHVADSNLHIVVRVPAGKSALEDDINAVVYGIVGDMGGSISAEHGIGRLKRPYLRLCRSEAELSLMTSIKRALDPKGILNYGRLI